MSVQEDETQHEFSKNPGLKKEDLQELRRWMRTQEHLPYIPERKLIVFLHSCYYNVAHTRNCIETYYTMKMNSPEFFGNRDLQHPENQIMFNILNYIELPNKDPNGNHILFHSLKDTEPSKYILVSATRIYIMMVEACLRHEGTSPGIILLGDVKGVKFGHITRLGLSTMHKIIIFLQEALPIRLKAIHILNTAPVIDKFFKIIKPFLKEDIINLLHFHKGSNASIHKYLPKKCLPQDFGGELPTVAELEASYIPELYKLQDYFNEEQKFQVDESKRSSRRKRNNDYVPYETLKSLVID